MDQLTSKYRMIYHCYRKNSFCQTYYIEITDSGQFIDFNLSINEYLKEIDVLPSDKFFILSLSFFHTYKIDSSFY